MPTDVRYLDQLWLDSLSERVNQIPPVDDFYSAFDQDNSELDQEIQRTLNRHEVSSTRAEANESEDPVPAHHQGGWEVILTEEESLERLFMNNEALHSLQANAAEFQSGRCASRMSLPQAVTVDRTAPLKLPPKGVSLLQQLMDDD